VQILLGQPPSRWWLPLALMAGVALSRPRLLRPRPPQLRSPQRGNASLALVALAAVIAAAIAFGAVMTSDRSWDGFTTWSLNARALALGQGLHHAYFADPTVYHFARGYPLLQPILLQQTSAWLGEQGGRLLFPALWLLWVGAVGTALADLDVPKQRRSLALAGAMLVPIFMDPGHGGADSGFADLLVALLLTHGVAALLRKRPWHVAAVGLLLPWSKVEGLAYAAMLAAVAGLGGQRRVGMATAAGAAAGLLVWLPIRAWLVAPRGADGVSAALSGAAPLDAPLDALLPTMLPALLPALAAAVAIGLRDPRLRAPALLLAAGALWVWLAWGRTPATGLPSWPKIHWLELPGIACEGLKKTLWVRKLGLTFPLLGVLLWLGVRRRALRPAAPAVGFLAAAALAVAGFLATRPPEDLPLFFREGLVRYVAQSAGVAWLAIAVLLREFDRDPTPPAAPPAAREP
jgi:hypothetical protein